MYEDHTDICILGKNCPSHNVERMYWKFDKLGSRGTRWVFCHYYLNISKYLRVKSQSSEPFAHINSFSSNNNSVSWVLSLASCDREGN